jgi:aldehyde dehydrogenase (NAD+)
MLEFQRLSRSTLSSPGRPHVLVCTTSGVPPFATTAEAKCCPEYPLSAKTSPGLSGKVTFTCSTAVGRSILRSAAETMKRVTLELGGKGPQIILDNADLDTVIPAVVLEKLKAEVAAVCAGDPNDPAVSVGPTVSRKQWDRVQSYLKLGQEEGAALLVGGEGRPDGLEHGWFVRPTVFTGATNDMRIAREEIFGPVLSVIGYTTEAEAIAIANDTTYGLQSYVLSSDLDRARRVAAQLETGRVVINGALHEPSAPFGGFKQSGIGRERGVIGLEAPWNPGPC